MARLSAAALALTLAGWSAPASAAPVAVLKLDNAIQPASQRYLERGLARAHALDAEVVIVELDTPGGLLVSLREMTTAITTSPVPVVVYVAPPGARAASAGFFLLIAADVAAMAPGTNAGAAHPVELGKEVPQVAIEKATEDAAALVRSLAARRGRSVHAAEQAVKQSRAYAAEEAQQVELIEIIATSRRDLIQQLDGRPIQRFGGEAQTLALADRRITLIEPTPSERLLMVIADPQVAYLLLMAGLFGLLIELLTPGTMVPGVVGGICLLLGLYGLSVLPVNWVGVLLIVLGFGLLAAEPFIASYGLLTLAGLSSFVLGSMMLVDSPVAGLRIGLELILPIALVLGAVSLFLLGRALHLRGAPAKAGAEAMIGEVGELVSPIARDRGEGKVFVHGEYWTATAARPLPEGARVRVERIEGHRLHVDAIEHSLNR